MATTTSYIPAPTVSTLTPASKGQLAAFDSMVNSGDYQGAADYGRSQGYSDADIGAYVGSSGVKDSAGLAVSAPNALNWLSAHPTMKTVTTADAVNTAAPAAQKTAGTQYQQSANDTMQGQLHGIMDPNNPLMQQAQTQGLQIANDRGLINSSIGQTAAQNSMYSAAVPIATTGSQQASQIGMSNAGNAVNLSNAALAADTQKYGIDVGAATSITNANTAAATSKYGTDTASTSTAVQDTGATTRTAISAVTAIMSTVQTQQQAILADSRYPDTASKEAARDVVNINAKLSLEMIKASAPAVDISSFMNELFPA